MIDGLKLTLSGEELRARLEDRLRSHQECASRWTHERERTEADATEEEPLVPDQICEYEAERHTWRAEVLTFIRDHVDSAETYRLGAADLEYAEVLPEKPRCVEQDEYEEQTRVGFGLERLVKSVDGLVGLAARWRYRAESENEERDAASGMTVDDNDEFRTTRFTAGDGLEVVKIERK